MNKTVNINLAGIFFHIDEDAYKKLQRYLEAIRRSFTDSQGRSEIIADIEARVAELFSERVENDKQVVSIKHVEDVIAIMGQPEDYLVDDEIFEDEPQPKKKTSSTKATKKLFRDTESSYIGGVASGLAHYLAVDVIWIRLLWILFALGSGGTFIIIYLIFWALVPEALTTSEKLTMAGDPVTISNIEKKIKDSIESVVDTAKNIDFEKHGDKLKEEINNVTDSITDSVKQIDFQKKGSKLKSSSKSFFGGLGDVIGFFLKAIGKFIGIILIITGAAALLGMIVGLFSVGIFDFIHIPGIDFAYAAIASNTPVWLVSILTFLAVGIPFFFLFYVGLRILVSNLKSIGNIAKFSLLGLWLFAIIGLVIFGVRQATEHAYTGNFTKKSTLPISTTDTLNIKMTAQDNMTFIGERHRMFEDNWRYEDNKFYRNGGFNIVFNEEDEKYIYSTDIRLIVRSTNEDMAYISLEKRAQGSNYKNASEQAENVIYNFKMDGNTLLLDSYLLTEFENGFNFEEVTIKLYLPIGTIINADKNTYTYHRNQSHFNDILDNGMEDYYLEVIDGDLKCLNCPLESIEDVKTNRSTQNSNREEKLEVIVNNDSIVASKNGVNVKVSDKDGVKISSHNNN
ncbi:PspC domain-containing protein [Ichthyenterobacterium sp. W332]|uniref:PspC domain-containing protein n=1 Tax=Microcosmobacter mediterraneus TaxID=3075607 RepID=A0ABU2YLT7_9FLAO|nr:PspC domain-containing protein [Ichthyenterobacterium sp. W332]MDT0559117.1 PspC domain-containing protein [Ichthyenterobacterium sp. W332]